MAKRDLVVIDVELAEATQRKRRHDDPLSRLGNSKTIDALLDERFQLTNPSSKKN
jgi:hypothetical protein